jgi:C-terminal peptidase prc
MRNAPRLLIFLTLLLSILACQAVTQPFLQALEPSPTQPVIASPPPATLSPTITASPSVTATSQASPTVQEQLQAQPTHTPPPSATAESTEIQPTPLSAQVQLGIFEDLWTTINDQYLYPDFNGQDWDAVYTEVRQQVEAGLSNQDFYLAMAEMVDRLGDDHSVFLSPEEVAAEDAEYAGNLNYVGIGVLITAVPENGSGVILVVFPGSPAEQAGLQPRDNILTVDGEAILDEDGYLKDIVRGPEGSLVTLLVRTPGTEPRELTITRRPISGAIPVPYTVVTSPNGLRIGYIFLAAFTDSTIDEQVGDALRAMTSGAQLDGLIIDDRENSGGADTVLKPVLGYFTSGVMGHFISRDEQRPLEIRLDDINGSGDIPLVVLVGKGTISYGEIFAGILKDAGRAYLIGETTDGNVETLWGYDFEDGSRAWIAHESFRPVNHPDEDWEQTGIIPDLVVAANFGDYTLETDPAVLAALEHFDSQ